VQFFANVRTIIDDIRHSWYFRIYSALWLFCAVFTFAVLIILGQQSTEAQKEPTFQFWRENATQINFPRFHFFISSPTDSFNQSVACTINGQPLQTIPCTWRGRTEPTNRCQAVLAENVVVENQWSHSIERRRIQCAFTTNHASVSLDNLFVEFRLEGEHIAHFGANSYSSLLLAPNNNSWILLKKDYITFYGHPEREEWERELVYHSTVSQPGIYRVSVIINHFRIIHGEQTDVFTGWMAIGEIGGFGYFLLLLHTLVIILIGICFNNDAKFLQGGESSYQSVADGTSREERSAMLST